MKFNFKKIAVSAGLVFAGGVLCYILPAFDNIVRPVGEKLKAATSKAAA